MTLNLQFFGGRGSRSGSSSGAISAIKEKYPKAVIGEIKDGEVTVKFSEKGKEYKYKVDNYEQLASKLGAEEGGFFGKTKQVSNQYFEMDRQVSADGKTSTFATTDAFVKDGSVVLITGPNEGIYLKNNQYQGVGIRNGDITTDALMVKMSQSDFENAKRYNFRSGFGAKTPSSTLTYSDIKKIAQSQEKGGNKYKTYAVAIYKNSMETSIGKKGRTII